MYTMNVLGNSLARPFAGIAYRSMGIRTFSSSMTSMREKYYKITKYAKPINTKKYEAGESVEGVAIPPFRSQYPEYAYETMFFKRQNRGLYGGLQRKRSKTCSESGNKNLSAHLPNIVKSKLWSETLNKSIRTRVATRVLKTITKEGGLDNYLTKDKPARIKTLGLKGWKLRYDVLKRQELEELPVVEVNGKSHKVYFTLSDGRKILVGRKKLLNALYELVRRDSYRPLEWKKFLASHAHLSIEEVVSKLDHYKYDFTPICA